MFGSLRYTHIKSCTEPYTPCAVVCTMYNVTKAQESCAQRRGCDLSESLTPWPSHPAIESTCVHVPHIVLMRTGHISTLRTILMYCGEHVQFVKVGRGGKLPPQLLPSKHTLQSDLKHEFSYNSCTPTNAGPGPQHNQACHQHIHQEAANCKKDFSSQKLRTEQ